MIIPTAGLSECLKQNKGVLLTSVYQAGKKWMGLENKAKSKIKQN
jgi:hypothetical protein